MKTFLRAFLSTVILGSAAAHAGPAVLATVHPLALVAASITPTQELQVLVPTGMTPHDFSLRPSDVDKVQSADVIFWAGEDAEPYLAGFVHRWPDKVWIDVASLAADDEVHDHAEHGHHDPHWWLDPLTIMSAQAELARALDKDPKPFADALQAQIESSYQQLTGVQQRGFFVFHRAYDHWVELMKLKQMGSFTLSPEQKPGLKTLQAMRQQLAAGDVVCVFSEPEFSPALVDSMVRGLDIARGELDPMAAHIRLSEDGYLVFLQDLTERFVRCLSE